MTRKDFVALAGDLNVTWNHHLETDAERTGFRLALGCIIDTCKRANPRFDVARFEAAVFKPYIKTV